MVFDKKALKANFFVKLKSLWPVKIVCAQIAVADPVEIRTKVN